MIPRVDFYILTTPEPKARYPFACRLADKAYRQGHKIYIHTHTESEARILDDLLWSFQEDSFLPHNLYGDPSITLTPAIQIGCQADPLEHSDTLFNLNPDIPNFYQRFKRVIEVIPNEPQAREQARQHFRSYRERGCDLHTHDFNKQVG